MKKLTKHLIAVAIFLQLAISSSASMVTIQSTSVYQGHIVFLVNSWGTSPQDGDTIKIWFEVVPQNGGGQHFYSDTLYRPFAYVSAYDTLNVSGVLLDSTWVVAYRYFKDSTMGHAPLSNTILLAPAETAPNINGVTPNVFTFGDTVEVYIPSLFSGNLAGIAWLLTSTVPDFSANVTTTHVDFSGNPAMTYGMMLFVGGQTPGSTRYIHVDLQNPATGGPYTAFSTSIFVPDPVVIHNPNMLTPTNISTSSVTVSYNATVTGTGFVNHYYQLSTDNFATPSPAIDFASEQVNGTLVSSSVDTFIGLLSVGMHYARAGYVSDQGDTVYTNTVMFEVLPIIDPLSIVAFNTVSVSFDSTFLNLSFVTGGGSMGQAYATVYSSVDNFVSPIWGPNSYPLNSNQSVGFIMANAPSTSYTLKAIVNSFYGDDTVFLSFTTPALPPVPPSATLVATAVGTDSVLVTVNVNPGTDGGYLEILRSDNPSFAPSFTLYLEPYDSVTINQTFVFTGIPNTMYWAKLNFFSYGSYGIVSVTDTALTDVLPLYPPQIGINGVPSLITGDGCTIGGVYDGIIGAPVITVYAMQNGVIDSFPLGQQSQITGSWEAVLTGLAATTNTQVWARATNQDGTTLSSTVSFITGVGSPTLGVIFSNYFVSSIVPNGTGVDIHYQYTGTGVGNYTRWVEVSDDAFFTPGAIPSGTISDYCDPAVTNTISYHLDATGYPAGTYSVRLSLLDDYHPMVLSNVLTFTVSYVSGIGTVIYQGTPKPGTAILSNMLGQNIGSVHVESITDFTLPSGLSAGKYFITVYPDDHSAPVTITLPVFGN